MVKCSYCEGHGQVDKNGNPPGSPSLQGQLMPCPECQGKGEVSMQVRLDIDLVPEPLYQSLLAEFRRQHGKGLYDKWEVTAEKEEQHGC